MKYYFSIIGFLSACFLFSCSTLNISDNKKNKEFDLYILAGQSNMAGRGLLTDSLKEIKNDRVWMLTKDFRWTVAKHPVHFDKPSIAGVGPGLSFGIEMAKACPNKQIGLIPCAVGGTSINVWQPGAFDQATFTYPYDDASVRIAEAMKYGRVRGMLWLQGEADCNEAMASIYLDKLQVLVKRLRKLTGEKDLPVVIGELGHFNSNNELINAELQKAPLRIRKLGVASSEGFIDKGDGVHFDAQSAIAYGRRFANEMIKVQKARRK